MKELEELAKPLSDYLKSHYHPHTTIVVTDERVTVVEDVDSIKIEDAREIENRSIPEICDEMMSHFRKRMREETEINFLISELLASISLYHKMEAEKTPPDENRTATGRNHLLRSVGGTQNGG